MGTWVGPQSLGLPGRGCPGDNQVSFTHISPQGSGSGARGESLGSLEAGVVLCCWGALHIVCAPTVSSGLNHMGRHRLQKVRVAMDCE